MMSISPRRDRSRCAAGLEHGRRRAFHLDADPQALLRKAVVLAISFFEASASFFRLRNRFVVPGRPCALAWFDDAPIQFSSM